MRMWRRVHRPPCAKLCVCVFVCGVCLPRYSIALVCVCDGVRRREFSNETPSGIDNTAVLS